MKNFFEWCFDLNRPFHIYLISILLLWLSVVFISVSTVYLLFVGLWFIPAILWIVFPVYYLVLSYLKDQNND